MTRALKHLKTILWDSPDLDPKQYTKDSCTRQLDMFDKNQLKLKLK